MTASPNVNANVATMRPGMPNYDEDESDRRLAEWDRTKASTWKEFKNHVKKQDNFQVILNSSLRS